MSKKPKTTGEHIISIYGHITGLKKDRANLKSNHISHLHADVTKIDKKLDEKFGTIINWIVYGLGGFAVVLLGQILYFFGK